MTFNVKSNDQEFILKASLARPNDDNSIDFFIFNGNSMSLCASFKSYEWFVCGNKKEADND